MRVDNAVDADALWTGSGTSYTTVPMPRGVRVWIATGHTDMRRGMQGLALQVQEQLKLLTARRRSLHFGTPRRPGDPVGTTALPPCAKRLDRGKFIWPSAKEGVVDLRRRWPTCSKGSTWRNPQPTRGGPKAPGERASGERWAGEEKHEVVF